MGGCHSRFGDSSQGMTAVEQFLIRTTPSFVIMLVIVAGHLHAADVPHSGWVSGPLVKVLADRSLKEVDEYGGSIPIGFAAFEKLLRCVRQIVVAAESLE